MGIDWDHDTAVIEYLSLQSGSVSRFGDTSGASYTYDITTVVENVAADQQLVVNGQSLQAGEAFTFDGSAELDGRFLVYAGFGLDTLTGGDGNDVFHFENGRFNATDTVDGGDGMDAAVVSMGNGVNNVEFGESQLANIEAVSFNNRFATDPSATPSYAVVLNNGNVGMGETLIVNGSSLLTPQFISVDGSAIADGQLAMYGGSGDDTFIGGDNDDLIYASGGADTSTGGSGADTFQYRNSADSAGSSIDTILDFEVGTDTIDLHYIDADSGTAPNEAFSFIGASAFSNTAGELRAEFDALNNVWLIEGDTDGVGGADFQIVVTATTADPILSTDFIL